MEAGEILLKKGLLNQQQLEASRAAQTEGARLDQAAVELGFVAEDTALKALGEEVGLDYVDLGTADIDLSLLGEFPQKFIHRESLFPIQRSNPDHSSSPESPAIPHLIGCSRA